jgi:hypothetical protein
MKAMLDPKIVAASTQRPAAFEQGIPVGRDSIRDSSHGRRMKVDMVAVRQG